MSHEIDQERLLDRFHELMDAADVNPAQRLELRADVELAVELLEYAIGRPKIRNPAAFAVKRFREARERQRQEDRLHEPDPVTLEQAEEALEAGRRLGLPALVIRNLEDAVRVAEARELSRS